MTLPRSAPLAAALVALLNTLPGTAQDRPTDPWLTDPVDCDLPLSAAAPDLAPATTHAVFAAGFAGHTAGAVIRHH